MPGGMRTLFHPFPPAIFEPRVIYIIGHFLVQHGDWLIFGKQVHLLPISCKINPSVGFSANIWALEAFFSFGNEEQERFLTPYFKMYLNLS